MLLLGMRLDDSIRGASLSLTSVPEGTSERVASEVISARKIRFLPVLDVNGKAVAVWLLDSPARRVTDNSALILAGGEGRRMGVLTASVPKPLLEVGGRTLIDRAIDACILHGIQNFFVSVNYLGESIENHLNSAGHQATFSWLRESKKLGTAGPLALIPNADDHPLVVVNADVLHRVDLTAMMSFHNESGSDFTIATKMYDQTIPFGVLGLDGSRVTSITEKPSHTFPVSGGIYIVSSDVRSLVRKDHYLDMPDLVERALADGFIVRAFSAYETILDVGTPESLRSAESLIASTELSSD
jgi:NDP-sugar pyrophosphorylase family protein